MHTTTSFNHNHFLDLNSMKELPETHAWSSPSSHHHHHPSNHPSCSTLDSVPIINLQDPKAMKLVGHACKNWGVFQITNHGVPANLLEDMESAGRKLFALPIHRKLKAARAPDGVSGYGVARISSFFPKLMWSEGFTIVGSVYELARKLWPKSYSSFCDLIDEYNEEMNKLAEKLMGLMLGSLGATMEDVKWCGSNGSNSCPALQFNSYPACPDPDRAMGLAAHTDSTLLTILHQNNTSGLQAHRDNGPNGPTWVTVPPIPGALVVNVGDLLHILSNGSYPSVLHRAVVNRTRHRLSVAYLYGPPTNVQISPLSKLTDQIHPPLFRPVTWSEYLGTKAKHFNKALSSVRLCAPLNGFVDSNDHNGVRVG